MFLLIDAGNTRVKWALAPEPTAVTAAALQPGALAGSGSQAPRWIGQGAVALAQLHTLSGAWQGMPITGVLVSNVAGTAVGEAIAQQLGRASSGAHAFEVEWLVSSAVRGGLRNGYREPARLGVDRFASAIGARTMYGPGPLLVVTCGTATTIDAVSADGEFEGGMILPGLDMMSAALSRNTAQLPQVDVANSAANNCSNPEADKTDPGAAPPSRFADNTRDAIASGCLAAQCGAIERAYALYGARGQGQVPSCILAGGAAPSIGACLTIPFRAAGNLVLAGLYHVAMEPKMEPNKEAKPPC